MKTEAKAARDRIRQKAWNTAKLGCAIHSLQTMDTLSFFETNEGAALLRGALDRLIALQSSLTPTAPSMARKGSWPQMGA